MKNIIVNKSNIIATIATLAIASNFYVQNANADVVITNGSAAFEIGAGANNTVGSITGLTAADITYDSGTVQTVLDSTINDVSENKTDIDTNTANITQNTTVQHLELV